MPLIAYRRNGESFVFRHKDEKFVFVFSVTDGLVVNFNLSTPKSAVVFVNNEKLSVGSVRKECWVQVDHEDETAYATVGISGRDRVKITFDASQSFQVDHKANNG